MHNQQKICKKINIMHKALHFKEYVQVVILYKNNEALFAE